MYRVDLSRAAAHDLDRLPSQQHDRIMPRIQALKEDPRPPGARKIVGSAKDWRIRIGHYRVVYEINDQQRVVTVMKVRRRSIAYR